jgi:cation transport ATPase
MYGCVGAGDHMPVKKHGDQHVCGGKILHGVFQVRVTMTVSFSKPKG